MEVAWWLERPLNNPLNSLRWNDRCSGVPTYHQVHYRLTWCKSEASAAILNRKPQHVYCHSRLQNTRRQDEIDQLQSMQRSTRRVLWWEHTERYSLYSSAACSRLHRFTLWELQSYLWAAREYDLQHLWAAWQLYGWSSL